MAGVWAGLAAHWLSRQRAGSSLMDARAAIRHRRVTKMRMHTSRILVGNKWFGAEKIH
jgi:hypothetical protein